MVHRAGFQLFELWAGLNWRWRVGIALFILAGATAYFFFGPEDVESRRRAVTATIGWIVGAILLLAGGPSDSEKKAYRF